jgi:hypothetical protein
VYYGIGSTPAVAGIQKTLAGRVPFLLFLAAPGVVGLGLLVWQLARLVRSLPAALRAPLAENAARIQLRIAAALGSIALAVTTAWAWLHGTQPSATLLSGVHVLDALSMLLLIAGVALMIAAFVFFPPSIGLVATTAGVLVPTIAVSSAFATTASLGALGIVLSQAAGSPGSRSGGNGQAGSDPGPPPDNGGLGSLVKVNKPDPAADALSQRIGGESRVRFENGPDNEFDAVSDQYVAQAKPANFTLNKAFRDQAQTTFRAAVQSGRRPYFQFDGPPRPGVLEALARYAQRYGVEPVIDLTPLGGG